MNDQARFPDRTTALVLVLVVLMPLVMPATLATQILIFAIATLSVILLFGSVGLLSFGQGLYLGAGAYVAGLLLRDVHIGLLPAILAATLATTVLAALLGAIIVRRRDIYFVMLTLAFAQMAYFAALALKDFTGGENGLSGLPRNFGISGLPIASPLAFYGLTGVLFSLAFLLVQRLNASPVGSVLVAIRDNEARTAAIGYNVAIYKLAAFAIAGGIVGLAGALHAAFLGFVPPTDIELEMSQRLVVMGLIGGVGSPAGSLIGAAFYILVSEGLSQVWARWMALIALLIIAIVLYLPGGLWSIGARLSAAAKREKHHG
jgi:branched-chain amino acid transport system permease protein